MKNKFFRKTAGIVSLVIVFFCVSLLFISKINGFDAPRLYIKEFNIKQTSFEAGGRVSGDFLVWNTNSFVMTDVAYKISLEQGDSIFGEQIFSVSDQIAPNQTLKQAFNYVVPRNIESGDYSLKVQMFLKSGMALNWATKDVKVNGGGEYLNIGGSYVVRGKESFDSSLGPSFGSDELPKLRTKIFNPGLQRIDFKPKVIIYFFQSNSDPLDSFAGSQYSVNSKESREIEIDMPKYSRPGSYLAKVDLVSDSGTVSNTQSFRWVVKGEGARILGVKLKDSVLQAGANIEAVVDFVGPADGSEGKDALLSIEIYNAENGKTVATGERRVKVGSTTRSEIFNLVSNLNATRSTVIVKLMNGNNELASYRTNFGKSLKDGGIETKDLQSDYGNYLIAGAIALVLILVIVVLVLIFFKKGKKLFLLLAVIGFVALTGGAGKVNASTLVMGWNTPVRDSLFNSGDPIFFSGGSDDGSCYNTLRSVEADAYICDINKSKCTSSLGKMKRYWAYTGGGLAYDSANKKIFLADFSTTENNWNRPGILSVDRDTKVQGVVIEGEGSGRGQVALGSAIGLFYSAPYLYVADSGNNRIIRFDPNNVDGTWTSYTHGGDNDLFTKPEGVVYVDPYVYVADTGNDRVVRFKINASGAANSPNKYGRSGSGNERFNTPRGISFGGDFIYVADSENKRIVRFKADGNNIDSWEQYKKDGDGNNFSTPKGIYYDSDTARLYITDNKEYGQRIIVTDPSKGDGEGSWKIFGSGQCNNGCKGKFYYPGGIFYEPSTSYIYLSDGPDNHRIVRFKPNDSPWTNNWDVYSFKIDGTYSIDAKVPLAFPYGFSFGDGVTNPLGAVYASVSASVTFVDVNAGIGRSDSNERVIINGLAPTIVPVFTAVGNVFNDLNKNKIKDVGEANYTGPVNITSAGGTVTVNADNSYIIRDLTEGAHTVSADFSPGLLPGYKLIEPVPSNFSVVVGTSCSVINPLTGGTCDGGGNINNLNFALSNSMPWIQTYGFDLRVDDGFTNLLPTNTACGGGSYTSGTLASFNNPGIIFSGDTNADFGQGASSSENWVVGGMSYPEVFSSTRPLKTSTQSLVAAAEKAGIDIIQLDSLNTCKNPSVSCNLQSMQKGFYYTSGDVNIDNSANFQNGNYIIVSGGTIRISNDKKITVDIDAMAIFSARDIVIDSTVRAATNTCSPLPEGQIQGIFSADRNIVVEGNNGDCATEDRMVNIEGSLIVNAAKVGGSLQNRRDLCGDNSAYPSLTVKARPDFILRIPGFLTTQNVISYEEEP